MSCFKSFLFFLFVSMPLGSFAQNTLTVTVEKVENADGYIAVGVYNQADGFLKEGKAIAGAFEKTVAGTTVVRIPNIPNGTYAVSIFHDENGNKELDTNFFGIPKEACAFSKAKMRTFGPPAFEDCAFEMTADFEIAIPFE